MKKIILILVMLICTQIQSQTQKKDLRFTVAGIPLIGEREGTTGMSGVVIKPSFGYYITDSFSVDIAFTYSSLNDLTISNIPSNYNSYAFVPSLRYNLINKKKFDVFLESGFGLGTIKYKADNSSENLEIHRRNSGGISIFSIGAGGEYFFNNRFGIQLILPYISVNNITSDSIGNIYYGLSPTIGITFKI